MRYQESAHRTRTFRECKPFCTTEDPGKRVFHILLLLDHILDVLLSVQLIVDQTAEVVYQIDVLNLVRIIKRTPVVAHRFTRELD